MKTEQNLVYGWFQKSGEHPPCLWMQAGVVPHKFCRNDFQCAVCPYDRALRRTAEENRLHSKEQGTRLKGGKAAIEHWQDRLRRLPYLKRPCIHHMKGEIEFRPCTLDYKCPECDFHQYFQDVFSVYAAVKPVDLLQVNSFSIPQGYYLHFGHAWMKTEDSGFVRIGLDDFAHRIFGPLDRIEAPLLGKKVRQGDSCLRLERAGKEAFVLAPVSGVVSEVNPEIQKDASTGRCEPYSKGWIMRMHVSNLRQEVRQLILGGEAYDFLHNEVQNLYSLLEELQGPLAADGGQLVDDLYGSLPEIGWDRLSRVVLRNQ